MNPQEINEKVEKDIKKNIQVCSKSVNKNVFWSLVLCTLYGMADNLWSGTVFVAYLKLINGGENAAVGYVEGANGLSGLFTALPIGYLADKYPRSRIIKFGGVALILTALAHSSVMFYVGNEVPEDPDKVDFSLYLFLGVMTLWGAAGGVVNGPVQALYADSTPEGERTQYYVYLFASYMLSSCVGPLLSIFLFLYWGDDWSIEDLKNVTLVGMGLEVVAAFTMFFFDDKNALKERGEEEEEEKDEKDEKVGEDEEEVEENEPLLELISPEAEKLKQRRAWIPYYMFASDLIVSLGSGMTVKFFPVFFKDDCELSPVSVQTIYLIVPLLMVASSQIASGLSKVFGRVQTILLVKALGLSFLYAIIFKVDYLKHEPFLLIPLYVLRTALMNSTYPMQESILMDFVPKKERARWKSLESVSQFGWCGSAVLGGLLADRFDYTFTFLITAIVQSVGTLMCVVLIPLVPRSEKSLAEDRKSEALARKSKGSRGSLSEPLLGGEDEEADSSRMSGVV
ncbi:hypothetical protein TL16_g12906 [Triparma laevis f. inornata]|uniref:Major facilitator superfamily (MFS) profile domain-containing protein n=2 Tax=Triparma laevis TaxID=1534972 RepID=A0A9W7E533_9STRA|nr:hypothetical protein TrLO_g8832 [Triparma laevis f. longispina]GMH94435.1 hypothetical protein TL16_g12906 [Triparma laevis f. inornata]